MERYEERTESRREKIERLQQELARAKQDWIAHKRQSGGALRALIEECLPKTVGQPSNNNTILSSAPIGMPQLQREALIEDIFHMLADNSGRFIRAMMDDFASRFDLQVRRIKVEDDEKWRDWVFRVPEIPMPTGWRVRVTPPYAGALVRFGVTNLSGQHKSVYLDVWNRLGYMGEPYWEVYPVNNEPARCTMEDVAELVRLIEAPRGDEREATVDRFTGEPAGPQLLTEDPDND